MYRAVFFTLALAGTAHADDTPGRYHNDKMTVIVHNSMKPLFLVEGDNPIGKPSTFMCRAPVKCVVIMSASIKDNDAGLIYGTCSYVDGIAGAPGCGPDPQFRNQDIGMSYSHQEIFVGRGPHTITTLVTAPYPNAQVLGWAVEYAIYELATKGAN
jgi:hypothetical protein